MRAIAAGALALALVLGAAACGGDDEDQATTPATASVTPVDAHLFGDAVVRPEGDEQEAVDAALSKLLATDDPGAFLVEQFDDELAAEELPITYSEDIEPWLGESLGFYIESFTANPEGAVIAEVIDQAAATETIDKLSEESGSTLRDRSYNGVDYQTTDDEAVGFVEDFLVAGTETGFRDAVDASQGDSLADDEEFGDRLASAPDETVAMVYADVPAVLEGAFGGLEVDVEMLNRLLGPLESDGPALASLAVDSDRITLQADTAPEESPAEQSDLLSTLPAESWLAFGVAGVSDYIAQGLGNQAPVGDLGLEKIWPYELEDLERVGGWIGEAGGYFGGTSIFGIAGAVVLETTDETASANALDLIARALARDRSLGIAPPEGGGPGFTINPRGAPIQIVVTQREGRVVAGLGESSVEDALDPEQALGDSDAFSPAAEALGSDYAPALFLDFVPMLELVESVGADDDPDFQAAKPYLAHLAYLVAGARNDGERTLTRAVLGLR
jgi:hypothetical protein